MKANSRPKFAAVADSKPDNNNSTSNNNEVDEEQTTTASTPIESEDVNSPLLQCGGRKLRITFACLLVCTGVCLGILYGYWEQSLSHSRRTATFQSDSKRMSDSLVRAFGQYLGAAAVGHNYMMAYGSVEPPSRRGFAGFAEVFTNLGLHFQVMCYIPRVLTSEREILENDAAEYWSNYFAEFGIDHNYTGIRGIEPNPDKPGEVTIMKRSDQEHYYPVHFIHPVEGNLEALDFDLYSSGVRRNTIDTARFSGNPGLTARVRLVQDTSDSVYSVLLLWPGPDAEDHLVSIVLRIPDLLISAFSELKYGVEVYLYDNITDAQGGGPTFEFLGGHVVGVGTDSSKYLLPETELSEVMASATTEALVKSQSLSFADRSWVFVTRSTADYQQANLTSRIVGGTLLGLLGVLLAGWYIMDVRMHDRVAQHQATHKIKEATAAAIAERTVNAFVAHEVRNPLGVALTANRFTLSKVQEAKSWPDEDARQGVLHDASLVQASLTFIHELLDNIVDINQFAQHKLAMNTASLSLRDHVLLRVQRMLGDESMAGNIDVSNPEQQYPTRLVVDTGDDALWVIADGTRLVQVVLNLVKNAMRLAPDGSITISARRKTANSNKGVVIKVSDTGPGVPKHVKACLFDKSTVDLSHQNTGIGLHLCHCIVTSMDGRIYLDESYDSGVAGSPGACFVVDLPILLIPNLDGTSTRNNKTQEMKKAEMVPPVDVTSNAVLASPEATKDLSLGSTSDVEDVNSVASSHSGGSIHASLQRRVKRSNSSETKNSTDGVGAVPRRCLIIDDDAVVRAMLKRQIKVCFPTWSIETADSGEAALALVKPKAVGGLGLQFDVCLVDQYMPGPNNPMTGDQVIGAMRNINMAGYRIGCSANLVEALHVGAGADGFIRKPADNAALREVVRRVFASPPLRSCLIIAKNKTMRSEIRNRLKGAVASNCRFKEAESVDSAVEMAQTARSHTSADGLSEGAIELIVVDEVSCMSGMVLASAVAERLRRQVSAAAKVVVVSSNAEITNSDGTRNMPMGFNLAWPRPLPLAGVMRADLMRVLLPSGGCSSTALETDRVNDEMAGPLPVPGVNSGHCTVEIR